MTHDNTYEKPTILLLDDEQDILNALKRLLRKDYNIVTFNEGQDALDYLADNTVQIIMSDTRMPHMDGAKFLSLARKIQPDPIRILLTGFSDLQSTISAINEGHVYTYISKPWDNEALKLTLQKATSHFQLEKEKEQLTEKLAVANKHLQQCNQSLEHKVSERTQALQASKKKVTDSLATQKQLLIDVLDMLSATIEYRTGFGANHLKRIAKQCRALAEKIALDEAECKRIYLSALLHEIGMVGLSDEALESDDITTTNFPEIGAAIIQKVHRLQGLTENILHQNENFDGTGFPSHLKGDDIPKGARIIRIVKDFDYLIAGKKNLKKMSIQAAQSWMDVRAGKCYDREILAAFNQLLANKNDFEDTGMEYSVGIELLREGDVLTEDLVLNNGNVMLKAGQKINQAVIEKLHHYEETTNTRVTLFVS